MLYNRAKFQTYINCFERIGSFWFNSSQ